MPKDMIDMAEMTQLVTEVKTGFEAFKSAVEERDKELAKKGDVDVLIEDKLKKLNDELDKKQGQLDELYAAQNRSNTVFLDGKEVDRAEMEQKAQDWATMLAQRGNRAVPEFDLDALAEYKGAFNQFLRTDERKLTGDELKALSVGSDPDGGYVVHPDMSGRMVRKEFETSPMRQYANIQAISTDSLEGIYDTDETDAGWVSETGARPTTDTPEIGVWRIPVHELYAAPKATQKLLDDASIDMEAWLLNKISERFSRIENTAFVNGDGVGKPRGFLTYDAGTDINAQQIEQFNTGAANGFAADPNGGDALINMIYGTKERYRTNGRFFMNRTTLGTVRLLKDNEGRMLWAPSLAAGQPSTLLGHSVATFEDMPNVTTADALSVAFGDMNEAYQIVDRLGVRVLRDPYTKKPFIELYAVKRVGGAVINFEALKLLKTAA